MTKLPEIEVVDDKKTTTERIVQLVKDRFRKRYRIQEEKDEDSQGR